MRRLPWTTQSLILSVTLNVLLAATFFYFLIHQNPLQFAYPPSVESHITSPPFSLEKLSSLPFHDLQAMLQDEREVAYGYRVCDVALGALATYHDFDVERALGRGKLSHIEWKESEETFLIFPKLSKSDFQTLLAFSETEKWPFHYKKMYETIQASGIEKCDPELLLYFCHTPQFISLQTLFSRAQIPIQKRTLLQLSLEMGWEPLAEFLEEEKTNCNFSPEKRRQLLVKALHQGSQTALQLILKTDLEFAVKHLPDSELNLLLSALEIETQEGQHLCQMIIQSPRQGAPRDKACMLLGLKPEEPELAGKFYEKPGIQELRPVFREQPPAAPPPGVHVIQPGESLWLIARKYKLPLERLMEANHLQSTVIQPGRTLKIPN